MATILVTGGTGTLGRAVVERLWERGHEVRVLSRAAHDEDEDTARPRRRSYAVDLRDGHGLAEAVAGVETIVHCASSPSGGDVEAAGRLIEAARGAGVGHLVYISIVGVDRVPIRYYKAKLEVERLLEESGLGWTVLRATQFHDLVLRAVKSGARLPVIPVPRGLRVQPVDVREVADRLVELSLAAPAGRVPDMGGPEVLTLRELVRATLRAGGRRRVLLPLWLPGRAFAAFRRGEHLAPARATGKLTYDAHLADRAAGARR